MPTQPAVKEADSKAAAPAAGPAADGGLWGSTGNQPLSSPLFDSLATTAPAATPAAKPVLPVPMPTAAPPPPDPGGPMVFGGAAAAAAAAAAPAARAAPPDEVPVTDYPHLKHIGREKFLADLVAAGNPGACSALTVAWHVGAIRPEAAPGGVGLPKERVKILLGLKKLIDHIVDVRCQEAKYREFNNANFTAAVMQRVATNRWVCSIDEDNWADKEQVVLDAMVAGNVVEKATPPAPARLTERSLARSPLARLTVDVLAGFILNDALDDFLLESRTQLNVSISASRGGAAGPADFANHQFGVRYEPGDRATGTLEIFDQNTGLSTKAVRSDDDVADAVAEHLHRYYVLDPMRAAAGLTTEASVHVTTTQH